MPPKPRGSEPGRHAAVAIHAAHERGRCHRVITRLPQQHRTIHMLELRPSCENCDIALPPDSTEAMICTFECTFCRSCVENILGNVCPNCGGGFCARPVRPKRNWKSGDYLGAYPASKVIKHC